MGPGDELMPSSMVVNALTIRWQLSEPPANGEVVRSSAALIDGHPCSWLRHALVVQPTARSKLPLADRISLGCKQQKHSSRLPQRPQFTTHAPTAAGCSHARAPCITRNPRNPSDTNLSPLQCLHASARLAPTATITSVHPPARSAYAFSPTHARHPQI